MDDVNQKKCCFLCNKKCDESIEEKEFDEMDFGLKKQYKGLVKCMFLKEWVCKDCFNNFTWETRVFNEDYFRWETQVFRRKAS